MVFFEKPIIVYSTYCNYSMQLLEKLSNEYKKIYDKLVRMNIDVNPNTGKRPKIFIDIQTMINYNIDRVPSLILEDGTVLTDTHIQNWIDIQNSNEIPAISGFDSFTENNNFSTIGNGNLQSDVFKSKMEKFSEKKIDMDSKFEKMMEERKMLDDTFKSQQQRF